MQHCDSPNPKGNGWGVHRLVSIIHCPEHKEIGRALIYAVVVMDCLCLRFRHCHRYG